MASDHGRQYFADKHMLLKTEYNNTSRHVCDVCRSKMAGLTGYRCGECDFDIHKACAEYFKQTISFFAHPWHTLTLSRLPTSSSTQCQWYCDLCMEYCTPGDLMYRCIDCNFDVHALCTMLPQTIRSNLHPEVPDHDLRLVPSPGKCSGCGCNNLSVVWNYVCSCPFRLHIGCVVGLPCHGGGQNQTSTTAASDTAPSSDQNRSTSTSTAADTAQSSGQNQTSTTTAAPSQRRPGRSVALFLLKAGATAMINTATHGLASPVLHVLEAVFD